MTLVFCLLCERKFTYSMLRKLENSKYNENHNIKILFITSIYGENLYLLKFKKGDNFEEYWNLFYQK